MPPFLITLGLKLLGYVQPIWGWLKDKAWPWFKINHAKVAWPLAGLFFVLWWLGGAKAVPASVQVASTQVQAQRTKAETGFELEIEPAAPCPPAAKNEAGACPPCPQCPKIKLAGHADSSSIQAQGQSLSVTAQAAGDLDWRRVGLFYAYTGGHNAGLQVDALKLGPAIISAGAGAGQSGWAVGVGASVPLSVLFGK